MANTLRYNNTIPSNIYYGGAAVQNVYYNNTKVWSSGPPVTGDLVVGNTVTFDNKNFVVVHNSGNQWYLANPIIVENTQFGSNSAYSGSILASKCANWLSNFSANAQTFMNNVTVNGVTAKVFVPSYEQVNNGFSYYNSNNRRICQLNGANRFWWTSSPHSRNVYYVNLDGALDYYNYPGESYGFRPHICIQV